MPSPSSTHPHLVLSLPSAPHDPLSLSLDYPYETYRLGAFHLLPCTADQFFYLPCDNDEKYELVEGNVWWKYEVLTRRHDEARDRIAAEIARIHRERGYGVVVRRTVDASKSSNDGSVSSRTRSSSRARSSLSTSNRRSSCTIRISDIAVFRSDHTPNWAELSPTSQNISFPREYPPLLVVEITSPSNRDVDLKAKWHEYAQAKVKCYVIVDQASDVDPSVIVGTLSRNGKYRQRVYRGDDVVHGLLFDQLGLSAQYLLDPPRSVKEIRDSPMKELKSIARNLEREIREKDRIISEMDRIISDKRRKGRGMDRTISNLRQRLAEVTNGGTSSSKARARAEKQAGSSSSLKRSRSPEGSSALENSPLQSPKPKRPKRKK